MSYGANSYVRPGLVLRTLENYLGEATMARVMRTYQQQWRYRHPAAPDFIRVVNEVSGKNIDWFFQRLVYSSNVLDYSVERASSTPVETAAGVFGWGDRKTTVSTESARKAGSEKRGGKEMYESKVTIRRNGEVIFPVDIRIVFDDGEVVRKQWDGEYRWVKYDFQRPAKLKSVEVDPDHKIPLDVNFANNSYRLQVDSRVTAKWSAELLFWIQNLLEMVSALT